MTALTAFPPVASGVETAWFAAVVAAERDALSRFLRRMPNGIDDIVALIAGQTRPIIIVGVGKSGHVAAKLAATFSSLGTPASFVNAAEAAHGDLGTVARGSVVLLLSNSGTTAEIVRILPQLKARGCTLVGIVGRPHSPIGQTVDHLVPAEVESEADHIGMAPTASTTLHLAIGDALAVAASRRRGFTRVDFLRHHPAGLLGHQALPVAGVMHCGDRLPTVSPSASLVDLLAVMSSKRLGATGVIDSDGRLLGLIVDGDVRRHLQSGASLDSATAGALMQPRPQVIGIDATVGDVLSLCSSGPNAWLVLPVVDDAGRLCGMLRTTDLMRTEP